MVCGVAKAADGLRRVAGAIKMLPDHPVEELVVDLSSSAQGRSPYKPPNILPRGGSTAWRRFSPGVLMKLETQADDRPSAGPPTLQF
ncbi:hypothetical protein GH714_017122 [Hevea brasiliensis]|uniref:Uncharacterized protein n=1 Tax=Hevea brasiliensis TaxID=3981 RepID=A0A6A6MAU8_HEVBR|nr:hypothetical protein GH714_017122 [Hevea brasiliensis]